MKPKELEALKKELADQKAQILANLSAVASEMSMAQKDDLKDEGDIASASEEILKGDAISLQQRKELEEIEYALSKIHKSTYGICEMCEEPIGMPRLKAKPFARYCIVCREIVEKEKNSMRRNK
jgi:DnaK suppressor protein